VEKDRAIVLGVGYKVEGVRWERRFRDI